MVRIWLVECLVTVCGFFVAVCGGLVTVCGLGWVCSPAGRSVCEFCRVFGHCEWFLGFCVVGLTTVDRCSNMGFVERRFFPTDRVTWSCHSSQRYKEVSYPTNVKVAVSP